MEQFDGIPSSTMSLISVVAVGDGTYNLNVTLRSRSGKVGSGRRGLYRYYVNDDGSITSPVFALSNEDWTFSIVYNPSTFIPSVKTFRIVLVDGEVSVSLPA